MITIFVIILLVFLMKIIDGIIFLLNELVIQILHIRQLLIILQDISSSSLTLLQAFHHFFAKVHFFS